MAGCMIIAMETLQVRRFFLSQQFVNKIMLVFISYFRDMK